MTCTEGTEGTEGGRGAAMTGFEKVGNVKGRGNDMGGAARGGATTTLGSEVLIRAGASSGYAR